MKKIVMEQISVEDIGKLKNDDYLLVTFKTNPKGLDKKFIDKTVRIGRLGEKLYGFDEEMNFKFVFSVEYIDELIVVFMEDQL